MSITTTPMADGKIAVKVNVLARAIKHGLRETHGEESVQPDDAACVIAAATLLAANENYVTFKLTTDE